MYCGIKSFATALEVEHLIERLDIERPYSPTYGDIRNDKPFKATHKGLFFYIIPRLHQPNEYAVELRGSLAKFATGGQHNRHQPNPYDMLGVLDELATDLRINLFATHLNNLEVMATIPVKNAERLLHNVIAYLGKSPKHGYGKDGFMYTDVALTQHRLKLYEVMKDYVRVEVHAHKMAYLGADRPRTLADLALPRYASPLATKLLEAFNKVIWDCTDLDPDTLPQTEGYLLAKGRHPAYWHMNRQEMTNKEYNRMRKQRERERPFFDAIIQRQWQDESPTRISHSIQQQLALYADIMHTGQYEQALKTCWERWQVVANLPRWAALPKRPSFTLLSQIYPLHMGQKATCQPKTTYERPTVKVLAEHPAKADAILEGLVPRRSRSGRRAETLVQKAHHRLRNLVSNEPNNTLRRLKKLLNAPGGLLLSCDQIRSLISPKGQQALNYRQLSLDELKQALVYPTEPLFEPLASVANQACMGQVASPLAPILPSSSSIRTLQ